jgi:hypothetical protein
VWFELALIFSYTACSHFALTQFQSSGVSKPHFLFLEFTTDDLIFKNKIEKSKKTVSQEIGDDKGSEYCYQITRITLKKMENSKKS